MSNGTFPPELVLTYQRIRDLRYGENPHQEAALYLQINGPTGCQIVGAEPLAENKVLSYNNYRDLHACLEMVLDFREPFACLVKHRNPCGAATASTLAEAYAAALATDPLSAFGCIIGVNRVVDIDAARVIHETNFVECILAPGYTEEALTLLQKKKQRRILELPAILDDSGSDQLVFTHIDGGLLVQTTDHRLTALADLKTVTNRMPTQDEYRSLLFAEQVAKHTISNAIVLVQGTATVGIGGGNTSRVDSAWMAVKRAGDRARGAVVASDAFFPMPDGVEVCTNAGATAFIQPGGSKGDVEVIAAADQADAAMVFTGNRHFKH